MKRAFCSGLVICFAVLAGCSARFEAGAGRGNFRATNQREVLLRTDRDFSAASARWGAASAFATYAAGNAIMLPEGRDPVKGREAIEKFMSGTSGTVLTWSPLDAAVSAEGDLGYTWGRFESKGTTASGQSSSQTGNYVSIWKRQSDGSWKWVLDIGNKDPK